MSKEVKIILLIIVGMIITTIIQVVMFFLISFVATNIFYVSDEEYIFNDINEKTNVSFDTCNIISESDTHGGFLGDGKKIVIYYCGDDFNTKNILNNWKKFPSENLDIYFYGGAVKNGITYPKKDEENYSIPKLENGYYYFIDNYSKNYNDSDDIYSDDKILDMGRPHNFTLTVYDIDSNYLYFYEIDT